MIMAKKKFASPFVLFEGDLVEEPEETVLPGAGSALGEPQEDQVWAMPYGYWLDHVGKDYDENGIDEVDYWKWFRANGMDPSMAQPPYQGTPPLGD